MFSHQITPHLLEILKKIAVEVADLNRHRFSDVVLHELELEADAQSSFSSTGIEGNPLPLTEVKRILKTRPHKMRDTEREVLNYNDGLLWLKTQLASKKFEFSEKLILEIHKRVTTGLMPKSKIGRYRTEPVFVNDPKLRKTVYWPPDHDDVPGLMKKLVRFVSDNQERMDPIVLAGLFHRQFVIIHPFVDGNGRTVRLATKAILAALGIDTFHLFSFENYYNRNVTAYFQQVGVRGNYYELAESVGFTEWLEYFASGILDELLRVRKVLSSHPASTPEERVTDEQRKILTFIEKHGHIRDKDYAKLTARAKATRALDFKKLIELGLIERKGSGPATYYVLNQEPHRPIDDRESDRKA